ERDGDVALTAVERAELAGVAGLAGVGLARDLSCHGSLPDRGVHLVERVAASELQLGLRRYAGRDAVRGPCEARGSGPSGGPCPRGSRERCCGGRGSRG